jgi:hypothetical protein
MNPFGYFALNSLWLSGGAKAALKFRRALRQPQRSQEAILFSLLRQNANTRYGRTHGFHRLQTIRDYQDAVPVIGFDALAEEIEAIKAGQPGVLTEESVLALERTSGSTAAAKYVPYTARLLREFQAAIGPWMTDLYCHRPAMLGGGAYWSVSPLASKPELTSGGLPVGFADELEYFGGFGRRLLARLLVTPAELPKIPDIEASRYVTLRFLLATARLTFISVWNPSFLTLLITALEENFESLLFDLKEGTLKPPSPLPRHIQAALCDGVVPLPKRAQQLRAILRQYGGLPAAEIWPQLRVISCWADAGATLFLPELRRRFPGIEIQPKGLLATEGVVSLPLTDQPGAALAITSHFLEFIDDEKPNARPLLAHELDKGSIYSVLLTTGGGLYRYRLGDRVRVVGKVEATPLVEFVGRSEDTSDLCGEKLHEPFVRGVLDQVLDEFRIAPLFAMVAPEWGRPPGYVLFLEAMNVTPELMSQLVSRLEAGLLAGTHYAYCRRLGQLSPLRGVRIAGGANRSYIERCARMGQRRGNIKPTVLHRQTGWSEWFHAVSSQTDLSDTR